jgi:hypothetical protein
LLRGAVERAGERPVDQPGDAAADVGRNLRRVAARKADIGEHRVRRSGNIRGGIEERAVEVAEDGA